MNNQINNEGSAKNKDCCSINSWCGCRKFPQRKNKNYRCRNTCGNEENNPYECHNAYSSMIASAGQSATHVPHEMHLSWSMMRASLLSEIAPTGQSGSQAPQFTHASVILNIKYSHKINLVM